MLASLSIRERSPTGNMSSPDGDVRASAPPGDSGRSSCGGTGEGGAGDRRNALHAADRTGDPSTVVVGDATISIGTGAVEHPPDTSGDAALSCHVHAVHGQRASSVSPVGGPEESNSSLSPGIVVGNASSASQARCGGLTAARQRRLPHTRSGPQGPSDAQEVQSDNVRALLARMQYEPTYSPAVNPDGTRDLGCVHYKRSCKLFARCCGVYVTCRLCHDEVFDCDARRTLPHTLDRHAVESVLCMRCWMPQDVSPNCVHCGLAFAKYFCEVCRLYAADKDGIFHCEKCGLCRRGKRDDNVHCDICQSCILKSAKYKHYCTTESMAGDCGICMAPLRTSTTPVIFLRCGHALHEPCFQELSQRDYRCCLCLRSFSDMQHYYEQIDRTLEGEGPMPEEYADRRCEVLCNDCLNRSIAPWHYQYFKCHAEITDESGARRICGSYNTRLLR